MVNAAGLVGKMSGTEKTSALGPLPISPLAQGGATSAHQDPPTCIRGNSDPTIVLFSCILILIE